MGTGPTPHYLGITPGATNRAVRAKYRRRDGALLAKNSTQGCATEPMRARGYAAICRFLFSGLRCILAPVRQSNVSLGAETPYTEKIRQIQPDR